MLERGRRRDRDGWLPEAVGGKESEVTANGSGISLWDDEDILELNYGGGCAIL